MAKKTAISPTRSEDYPEWYQQVIKAAELAETTSVRGCMVIRPWGYGLWESLQRQLDLRLKALGHENIYCPLLIPLSHLEKEAKHVEGFAKECAVVTHHRLETNEEGRLVPAGPLEEPLVIRPTSETMMGEMFSRWVQSYRDLPLLVNQWANIVRWEMRTRLFLRTTEFLWQEGHTVHATEAEGRVHALTMLDVYHDFLADVMAIPVIRGEKTESERFPGAVNTYCIEAMMQDKKALQAGTSHFLGQNFSRAFDIQYLNEAGEQTFGWTTSWGVTTRLIGALIMTHADDDGLVVPPRLAHLHVVILPILRGGEASDKVLAYCDEIAKKLRGLTYHGVPLAIKIDRREMRGGEKAWYWVKKGVPMRIEVGPKECEANQVSMTRRDQGYADRQKMSVDELSQSLIAQLDEMQSHLYQRALTFREENTHVIDDEKAFYQFFKKGNGFVAAHWCGDAEVEAKIQKDLSVTIRCLPADKSAPGVCIFTGKPSAQRVIFAQAY